MPGLIVEPVVRPVVMEGTQHRPVGEVRSASFAEWDAMMRLAPCRGDRAPGGLAGRVVELHRPALAGSEEPAPAAEVQDAGRAVEDGRQDLVRTREPAYLARR